MSASGLRCHATPGAARPRPGSTAIPATAPFLFIDTCPPSAVLRCTARHAEGNVQKWDKQYLFDLNQGISDPARPGRRGLDVVSTGPVCALTSHDDNRAIPCIRPIAGGKVSAVPSDGGGVRDG